MASPRLFLPSGSFGSEVRIAEQDFHHLSRVLRARPGDNVILLDGMGDAYEAELIEVGRNEARARVAGVMPRPYEPSLRITVAQALGKGDKFEQVIQHGTEIGAAGFIPLTTARTVALLDSGSARQKRERWKLVAKGAAEQCGRGRIPDIHPAVTLTSLASDWGAWSGVIVLHPGGESLCGFAPPAATDLLLVVGPEGGFTNDEVALTLASGARTAGLGRLVLRTETAALAALSLLLIASAEKCGSSDQTG